MKDQPTKHVYYAHSMQLYGTLKEKQELKYLNKRFQDVLCPNQHIGKVQMHVYLKFVDWADLVVTSEYEGYIGKGVFTEVEHALINGIPVKVL